MQTPTSLPTRAKPGVASPGTAAAAGVAELFLADGQWQAKSAVDKIARVFQCSCGALADVAHLAQSDSGAYACLPNAETPLLAPDEVEDGATVAERRIMAAADRRRVDALLQERPAT